MAQEFSQAATSIQLASRRTNISHLGERETHLPNCLWVGGYCWWKKSTRVFKNIQPVLGLGLFKTIHTGYVDVFVFQDTMGYHGIPWDTMGYHGIPWDTGYHGIPWDTMGYRDTAIHPGKLTWNLKMNPLKRRFLLETIIFRFQPLVFGGGGTHFSTCANFESSLSNAIFSSSAL